jgi:hypothetical protein
MQSRDQESQVPINHHQEAGSEDHKESRKWQITDVQGKRKVKSWIAQDRLTQRRRTSRAELPGYLQKKNC